jgi:hypothetical protein
VQIQRCAGLDPSIIMKQPPASEILPARMPTVSMRNGLTTSPAPLAAVQHGVDAVDLLDDQLDRSRGITSYRSPYRSRRTRPARSTYA